MQNYNSRAVRSEVQAMQQKTTYYKPTNNDAKAVNKATYFVLALFAVITVILCSVGLIPIY